MFLNVDALAGCAAGALSTLATHPLDTVKVTMQVNTAHHAARPRLWATVKQLAAQGGVAAFYRGAAPAGVASAASWGCYFYLYEAAKARLLRNAQANASGNAAPRLSATQHLYAAWEAGTMVCFVTNPLWLIKTRLQLQQNPSAPAPAPAPGAVSSSGGGHTTPYRGMLHAVRQIVHEEGVRGLYKGIVPALFLVSHGMVQFTVYEEIKLLTAPQPPPTAAGGTHGGSVHRAAHHAADVLKQPLMFFGAGFLSKAVATTVTYPYQVVKARLQQRYAGPPAYTGFIDCVVKVARGEGVRGFYKGFSANVLRVAPQSALTLVSYEYMKRMLNMLPAAQQQPPAHR